jgi:hypothetical protein
LWQAEIAHRQPDGTIHVKVDSPPGIFLHGPYCQLSSGIHKLSICCHPSISKLATQPVLGVEILARNNTAHVAFFDFTADELVNQPVTVEFEVPQELSRDGEEDVRFDFRLLHFGNADLSLSAVDLSFDELNGSCPVSKWRLLGRLRRSSISGSQAGGVISVAAREPAGEIAAHITPGLSLSSGSYCLRISCRAETPRATIHPVLEASVIARNRILHAWRDYTMDDLACGDTSLYFDVPPELGLDSGEAGEFDVKLMHCGNASLLVDAVELLRVQERPAQINCWRLLDRLRVAPRGTRTPQGTVTACPARRGGWLLRTEPMLLPPGRFELRVEVETSVMKAFLPDMTAKVYVRFVPRIGSFRNATFLKLRYASGKFSEKNRRSLVCDFDVPVELSCMADSDAFFELQIDHRGRSSLAVEAVTLRKLEGPFPPSERLYQRSNLVRSVARRLAYRPKRHNIVFVGNCQAAILREVFQVMEPLKDKYHSKYFFVDYRLHDVDKRDLASCDILVLQDTHNWSNSPVREYVPTGIPVVRFPALLLASPWPFDSGNGIPDRDAVAQTAPDSFFTFHDGLLARLRKRIPDREARFARYCLLDFDGVPNYVRLAELEQWRLMEMDRRFDSDIGAFILEQFKEQQLFYAPGHPCSTLFLKLLDFVLKHLRIKASRSQITAFARFATHEVPVHPKVAETLGISWAHRDRLYRHGHERLTWEGYTRRYIDAYG